jgi:hypothetical protein
VIRSLWRGGLFIALAVVVPGAVVLSLSRNATPRNAKPPHKRGACVLVVGGRTQLLWCADQRAYTREAGRWTDIGPLSPVPAVPQS